MRLTSFLVFCLAGGLVLVACSPPAKEEATEFASPLSASPSPSSLDASPVNTPTPFQPVLVTLLPTATETSLPTLPPELDPDYSQPGVPTPTPFPGVETLPTEPGVEKTSIINILLIGADQRSSSAFRTDTLIILSIRPQDHSVSLISIPRDLYVYIPGWKKNRINTAYLHGNLEDYPGGGPGLLKDTIHHNFGIQIDHLAMVDFGGFRNIVNALDGIDVPLACPFTDWHVKNPKKSINDPDNWKLYTIGPGVVHMDGDLALWYARSRLRSNDFDRGRRQQEVLRAIYTRALQLDVIPRLPELYNRMSETVTTDMSFSDLMALAPLAMDLEGPRIRSYYINDQFVKSYRTPEGASVLLPRGAKIKDLLAEALSPPGPETVERLGAVVEIVNAAGNPGWDVLAAERLHYGGFETEILSLEAAGLDPAGGYSKTLLFDLTEQQHGSQAKAVLAVLGLPVSRLRASPSAGSPAAYRLVLGPDYKPCFKP